MLRRLHALPGVALALGLSVVALTGAALSIEPALNRLAAPGIVQGVSVAALADAVAARHQRVEVIRQRADGAITVAFADGDVNGVERVDPATGAGLGPYKVSETSRFLTNLHRSFLAGDVGRAVAGIGALAMLVLAISGVAMLARRLGGASDRSRMVDSVAVVAEQAARRAAGR
ncbi:PepSY domain-containing protein [Methylocella sp.]|uniref:PepSY domain-containing protein n=1 Tax=Methylocella sp. TaxID=1978226 RepID=UPI0035AE06DB